LTACDNVTKTNLRKQGISS